VAPAASQWTVGFFGRLARAAAVILMASGWAPKGGLLGNWQARDAVPHVSTDYGSFMTKLGVNTTESAERGRL
jgi:hypothetical protein